MYTTAVRRNQQPEQKSAAAKGQDRPPPIAAPNSASAFLLGASSEGGYALPDLEQRMQGRVKGIHVDLAAEQEAVDVGKQFMGSGDVVGEMSRAYGEDLSSVRLHTDPGANRRAAERGVDAFSTGRDVYFAEGAFNQSDPASRGLLAHELSHSLQQGVGGESAMSQSAPMGAEQGGFLDWFRKKPSKKGPKMLRPLGTKMPSLAEGEYDSNTMSSRIGALLPEARQEIAKASADEKTTAYDGNRFAFLRGGKKGDSRIDYSSMMQKAGRETNKEFLNQMVESQEIAQLPDADAYGSYKHLMKVNKENTEENGENKEAEANAFDPNQAALQAEYRKGGLTATRQYLELLEGNEDAMDSLRQSASGLYGQLGVYSRGGENENLSGLIGGRMEAAHRAMNDMILRSFGPDTMTGLQDFALDEAHSKKIRFVSQAVGGIQPAVMNAEMNPEKMAELSEEEQEAANLYRDFFQRNGMLGDAGSRPGFTPGVKNSEETMPYRKYTGGGRPTEVDPARMSEDESLGMLYDTIKRHESAGDMDPEQLSDLKRQFAQRRSRQMSGGGGEAKKKKRFQFWKK